MTDSARKRLQLFASRDEQKRKLFSELRLDVPEVIRFLAVDEYAWQVDASTIARLFCVTDRRAVPDFVMRFCRAGELVALRTRRSRNEYYSRAAVERVIATAAGDRLPFIAAAAIAARPDLLIMGPAFLRALLVKVAEVGWPDEMPALPAVAEVPAP